MVTDLKNINQESMAFEHKYLRAEIESNKKLVFERALLIAAAAFAATLVPKNAQGVELLGLPSILALAFNLWFTTNRLKSNARIISYIQLFHESTTKLPWIGWENAIRLYRHCYKICPKKFEEAQEEFKNICEYDNLTFYKPIFILHIALVIAIAILMSFRSWADPVSSTLGINFPIILSIMNGAAAASFIIWAFSLFRPKNLRYGIEKNRILWKSVFLSYKKGELDKVR